MNARVAAFVACRLFAVYLFVIYVLNYVVQVIGAFIVRQTEAGERTWAYVELLTFTTAFYAVLAFGFWFGAGHVATKIVKALPETDNKGLSIDRWKALIVASIGALFIMAGVRFFTDAVRSLHSDGGTILPYMIISGGFYVAVGFVAVAWSGSIVSGVKALRAWFTKPAFGGGDK